MSDRYPPPHPDEPIIGAPAPGEAYIGADEPYSDPAIGDYDPVDEYDDDPYYDERGYYDDETPARQPLFYLFIGLAIILGAAFVVLLFSIVNGDGNGPSKPAAKFEVAVAQPLANEAIPTGQQFDILASASSNEPLARFELVVNGLSVAQALPGPPSGTLYSATIKFQFDKKGEYRIIVRVTSESGASADSPEVKVRAVELVGDKPVVISGKAITTTNVRTGPGEQFESVGVLTDGQAVQILGRTRNSDWLMIDFDGGRWVKRAAIQADESLDFLPIKEPTPTPVPAATSTPARSPSPSPSPSPGANTPDFVPTGAVLVDGGTKLRVTVANLSANNYNGPLVVSVADVAPQTLELAFAVNLLANGSTTVEFDLNPPVTTQKTAKVSVDPGNAVKEANEDNNVASIGLLPAVDQPDLRIGAVTAPAAGQLKITITNQGGALPVSEVKIRLTVGQDAVESTKSVALANGQATDFTVARPGSGSDATIQVFINGQPEASANVVLP